MSNHIQLSLVTPEREVLSEEVDAVVLPGSEGSYGVLPGHVPLVTGLKPGMLKVRIRDMETIYAVGGGYAEITAHRVVVLADTVEQAEEIDIEAARRERARALAQMKKGLTGAELEAVEISLKKALARLAVAGTLRRRQR